MARLEVEAGAKAAEAAAAIAGRLVVETGEARWAGAGIEGASAGGMTVARRGRGGWSGASVSCLRAGGVGNNSMEVGGRRGCRCYRGGVEGQQQQGWWRRDIRDSVARVWRSQAGWRQHQQQEEGWWQW